MTKLAREDAERNHPQAIQAMAEGVLQTITGVAAAEAVCFFDIHATAPDASTGNRIPIAPNSGMFWSCVPGDLVAAHASTGATATNAMGANTTVVYLYYDSTAGTAFVLECA